MELSTPENEAIVRSICEAVSANSGASFEQYFRWASVEEIGRVVPALRTVGLLDVAELTEKAIQVAFPKGIPSTDEEKADLTDWSEAQDERLRELFPAFEEQNGRITNVLAAFARKT